MMSGGGEQATANADARVAGEELRWRSGFLHYAAHDETVSSFGRNDGFFDLGEREQATATATAKTTADPSTSLRMTILRWGWRSRRWLEIEVVAGDRGQRW
jgi:hypothetical protein